MSVDDKNTLFKDFMNNFLNKTKSIGRFVPGRKPVMLSPNHKILWDSSHKGTYVRSKHGELK